MSAFIGSTLSSLQLSQASTFIAAIGLLIGFVLLRLAASSKALESVRVYAHFAWNCFFKPHTGDGSRNQQDALESFYKTQASIYDATRMRLLRGREEMLGLVAAQLKHKVEAGLLSSKPIWVDIGGGTGYNIEQMGKFVDIPSLFEAVYLVDLSPSLCQVAVDRFTRLGWKNVHVVCQDARHFRLDDHQSMNLLRDKYDGGVKAECITMSYSLSMIPEFYPVVDSISSLLSLNGIMGVADFYVQSEIEYGSRNYIGGEIGRHCIWVSRVFWRTWFEADRVSLEAARRDYLEYRFGTILSFNARCNMFGFRIPYYVWLGCSKEYGSVQKKLAQMNAAATESPYMAALDSCRTTLRQSQESSALDIRSKAYESAVINLNASLPLPAAWYQQHHWRIYYDDQLQKHKQFNDEYIYAFTWEDSRVDARLLKIQDDDVILAITSAGDNILAYALEGPKRIHAVDLNPNQNHLLELKVAALTSLSYADFWKMFGEGRHSSFRDLLITKLSPHMSSLAFQYWLAHGPLTFSGKGLYYTGGSRHAVALCARLFKIVRLTSKVRRLCASSTLAEQREIWSRSIRHVLLSRLLAWTVISNKGWLWRALGVPANQRAMIEHDYAKQDDAIIDADATVVAQVSDSKEAADVRNFGSGAAIWNYAVNTLDPVARDTSIADDNHYYHVCLAGRYSRRSHPSYLTPKAHVRLSRPRAFDGLRIHTDEVDQVLERLAPGSLTIAVVMDSMDWFDPNGAAADAQIGKLRSALKEGGRVLLRSAGLTPWYVARFEAAGFACKRVGARVPGSCIDRVNMYASTWICTKVVQSPRSPVKERTRSGRVRSMEPLSIGETLQEE